MVKSDIIKELKKKHPKLKLSQIESILDLIFDTISKRLINNRSIEIRDFCRFSIRTTKAKIVDVSSGVEKESGKKCHSLIKNFIKNANSINL